MSQKPSLNWEPNGFRSYVVVHGDLSARVFSPDEKMLWMWDVAVTNEGKRLGSGFKRTLLEAQLAAEGELGVTHAHE